MKKVMLVIVCMLFAATAFAQQSDPSNDVGYVKLSSIGSGTPGVQAVLPFGLPFKFWNVSANVPQYGVESTRPSSIIGAQTAQGTVTSADRIVRQDGGNFAYRANPAGAWTGSLETNQTMIPGAAYFYQNKTGANRTLVLAGDVQNTNDYGSVNIPGGASQTSWPLSWRDSRNIVIQTQVGPQLVAQGFTGGTALTSDQLVDQAGPIARVNAAGTTWSGTLTQLTPGKAYFIQNRPHANGAWVYNFATGAAAAGMNSGVELPPAVITKAPVSNESAKTSSVKSGTVKTTGSAK